jgi:thioredoxin reductase
MSNNATIQNNKSYDVIIIGGSFAGLSAAMTLGRCLRETLVIDSGLPCNRFTSESHNFITHDGEAPSAIAVLAKSQVQAYPGVQFLADLATNATGEQGDFTVSTQLHGDFKAKKLLFTTGVKDLLPAIPGFEECWGKSIQHCPLCHGYEFKGLKTGILMNTELAVDFGKMIKHFTTDLTLLTNGKAVLSAEQQQELTDRGITIIEKEIAGIVQHNGQLTAIAFTDGTQQPLEALYARLAFTQHCEVPQQMGCQLTDDGYIYTDELKKTTITGVYAAGDNTTRFRAVSQAVAAGTMAGAFINHDMVME